VEIENQGGRPKIVGRKCEGKEEKEISELLFPTTVEAATEMGIFYIQ